MKGLDMLSATPALIEAEPWTDLLTDSSLLSEPLGPEDCRDVWEIFHCWKEQQGRFGGGSPAPSIPRSQRQYDGGNWLDG